MIKCKVNTKVLKKFRPCQDRLDNWLKYYSKFNGDIVEFLDLPQITHKDKIWAATKLLPTTLVAAFAIDCGVSSQKCYAAAYATTYADNAASHAADAADAAYSDDTASHAAAAAYAAAAYAADAAYAAAAHATYIAYTYAADATTAAAYAYAAAAHAARQREEQSQIEALIWLIQNHKKGD